VGSQIDREEITPQFVRGNLMSKAISVLVDGERGLKAHRSALVVRDQKVARIGDIRPLDAASSLRLPAKGDPKLVMVHDVVGDALATMPSNP